MPAFTYGGDSYTRSAWPATGTLIVGGGTAADATPSNQRLPNAAPPNNVLAPFWTDLNPAASGAVRVGVLTNGVDQLDRGGLGGREGVQLDRRSSFEVWIGINTDARPEEDISFTYGPIGGSGDGSRLTVGVENLLGNSGDSYYFDGTFNDVADGTGSVPTIGTELVVASEPPAPGETRVIRFTARGTEKGKWRNCAEMTANTFFGTSTACFSGEVKGSHRSDHDCDRDDHHHHGGKGKDRDKDDDDHKRR